MGSSSKPPDDTIMKEINHGQTTNNQDQSSPKPSVPLNFRDAVASSSQWFMEARKIITTSLEWEEAEEKVPENSLAVAFDRITLDRLRAPWKLTLMGKYMGIQVKANYLEARVRAMWRITGSLEVIDIGKQVYLFKFTQTDDYERALFGGPWFIMGHYLMISTWKPNFRPSVNEFDFMSVWVRIEELPVEYYDKDALYEISKVIGKPIRVDYATDKVSRARYARVCVEIDLRKPIITKVWVGGFWQPVVYENITSLCFKCGKIGHVLEKCDQNDGAELDNTQQITEPTKHGQVEAHMEVDLKNQHNNMDIKEPRTQELDLYGPWTLVQNKRSPKTNFGKQRQINTRINEYKKNLASKVATPTSLNGVYLKTPRDKQTHQLEGEVNEPVLVAPDHTLLEISAAPYTWRIRSTTWRI
ncbi:uncharacterized protein [Spinacia oleracea]|uniref:CCHC-type domain-containing protein n=1 Tax=Spinacia oleracea TaxID=3562 RepID=A0A9R0JRY9_SPIOL|nr:uncharacterized protein LOC110784778 [Spinacia oleracea]